MGAALASALLVLLASAPMRAADESFCNTPMTRDAFLASDASKDLYNSLVWFGAAGAIHFGATPTRRWSSKNGFDDEIRSGLRGNTVSRRRDARLASDLLLGVSVGLLPVAAIGRTLFDRDCEQAYDMTTGVLESVSLTLFVTEAVKALAGRERPFVDGCDAPTRPSDSDCGDLDRFQSFFSGHASIAAAGAGVSCAFAIRRKTWGESKTAQALPCALGVGAALTTGALRIVTDKHWGSDVLVGLGVGALIGYFDTWGVFDLLEFELPSGDPARQTTGMLLPYSNQGALGASISLKF
jgi:membrane-associated phospholipid phosphatase